VPNLASSPPPKHRERISHRARGPGDRYHGLQRCAQAPGHPLHSVKLGEHGLSSYPQVSLPVVAQTPGPTW